MFNVIIGVGLFVAGMWYGSRRGMGEMLAMLIAHPEISAQEIRDDADELAHAEGANFEEWCYRWTVKQCDERIEFFKNVEF